MKIKYIKWILLTFIISNSFAQIKNDKVIVKNIPKSNKLHISEKFDLTTVKDYINPYGIKSKWVTVKSNQKDFKVSQGPSKEKKAQDGDLICNTVTKKLDVNSGTFMNSSSDLMIGKIYPGAIYPGDDFLKGNYNREIRENRLPIILKSNDPKIGKSVTVINPNEVNISNSVKELLSSVKTGSSATNLETKFRMFYSSNDEMTAFLLSTGASGYGVSVKASAESKNQTSKVVLTLDAYKSIYAIDAVSEGDNVYYTALPNNIKSSNLVIVNSVVYGTRVIANVTIECKSSEEAFKLASSYNGYGFKANLDLGYANQSNNKQITVNYKQVGGKNVTGVITTDINQLQNSIDKVLSSANFNNAVPISYNIRDLAGNNMGIQSTVDKFEETTCFKNLPIEKVFVKIGSGKDGKNADNYLSMRLIDQDGYLVADYKQTGKMELNKSSWSNLLVFKNISKTANASHFTKGGKLEIFVDHNGGKDDWYIDDVVLEIYLTDGSMLQTPAKEPIKWSKGQSQKSIRYLTKDSPKTELYFTSNFEGKP